MCISPDAEIPSLPTDLRDHYAYSVGDVRIVDGEGVYARSADGRTFIDCASGTFNLSLGYRHPAVVKALHDNADGLIHVTSAFQTDSVNNLVRRLVEISPANISRVHLKVSGGSTANEGAIKMAQRATNGRDVISMFRSHHGQTLAMTAISGNAFRREPFIDFPISKIIVPDPYCHRCFYRQKPQTCGMLCVDRIDQFIEFAGSGKPACVIVEPISGNGGNIVPPEGYLQALQKFCNERGLPLIFDEVQTGLGRTGSLFAAQHYGVTPDIITTAKGLGSGAPVAAVLSTAEMGKLETQELSFTYGANVLAAAVACATIDTINDSAFLDNVKYCGSVILQRLFTMQIRHRQISDVRGVGLMIGFELVNADGTPSAEMANAVADQARAFGLLLRMSQYGYGNVVKIRPPLVISVEESDLLCDRLEQLLNAVL